MITHPRFGEGVSIQPDATFERVIVQSACLTNIPIGETQPPDNEPWAVYLLGRIDHADGEHCVVMVQAPTSDELDAAVTRLTNRSDVVVVDDKDEHTTAGPLH